MRFGNYWDLLIPSDFKNKNEEKVIDGKEFRAGLRRPMPGHQISLRVVPAFTIQSMQRGTIVLPPPKSGALKEKMIKPTAFRSYYKRGDLPVVLEGEGNSRVVWKVDIEKLDYHHYLPMFFEGLCETENPYKFLAFRGIVDMLAHGGNKVFPCIPQLIIPLKNALNTKNKSIMISALKALQHLVRSHELVGEALVPYYRQLLPILNLYKEINVNCGDGIDYSQMHGENLADIICDTLEVLERFGGEDAFINIKYMIPTYESCMMN